jgi:hypothetical protein
MHSLRTAHTDIILRYAYLANHELHAKAVLEIWADLHMVPFEVRLLVLLSGSMPSFSRNLQSRLNYQSMDFIPINRYLFFIITNSRNQMSAK